MRMASCLAFTAQIHWSLLCFLVLVLSAGFSCRLLWWSALACTVPLKLGLMRASYPDVLPMSLSRKSEGDSCGPALLGGFISSLQELSLTLPGETGVERGSRRRGRTNTNRKKREKIWEIAEEDCVYVREVAAAGAVGEKIMRIQQNEKPTAISKSVISKKYPAVDREMRVKNDNWTACLSWQLKAYLFHIMSETYRGC